MCLKKQPRLKLKVDGYRCKSCGVFAKQKKKICKPKKIKIK